jgi:hypothetical protein
MAMGDVFEFATGQAQAQRDQQRVRIGQGVVGKFGVSAAEVEDNAGVRTLFI